jgi:hypothetical protein
LSANYCDWNNLIPLVQTQDQVNLLFSHFCTFLNILSGVFKHLSGVHQYGFRVHQNDNSQHWHIDERQDSVVEGFIQNNTVTIFPQQNTVPKPDTE